MAFADRTVAGRQLAARLGHLRGKDVVVLGLPRGGVPVASEVAASLGAPLDVLVVRKLGVPYQRELAMGAIGEDGVRVLNDEVLRLVKVSDADLAATEADERRELERRSKRFRGDRPRVQLKGRTAVIVDDGIATGATARAACEVARAQGAEHIVLAVPVAPPDTVRSLSRVTDEVVVVEQPAWLSSIGQWYDDFRQTSDEEVVALLDEAAARQVASEDVRIKSGGVELPGTLTVPASAAGIVVFAHGSGSSRLSPRNVQVAEALQATGLGTLLFDLLTEDEAVDRQNVFDIELLAGRMVGAIGWTRSHDLTADLPEATVCTVTVVADQVSDVDTTDPPDTMLENYVFSFTTTDPPPAVISTTPVDGGGIGPDGTITIEFSEPVNVTATAFVLECPVGTPFSLGIAPPPPGCSPGAQPPCRRENRADAGRVPRPVRRPGQTHP